MSDAIESWIQDGTQDAEPVTTETPAEDAAPAVAPAEQPRDDQGRFAAAETSGDVSAPAEGAAPAATEPPGPGASAQEIQDFIEAQLGEETFKIPKGVRLPLKRGGEVEYLEIEELQKRGMLEKDYRHKTAEHARTVRQFEQRKTQFEADRARLEAHAQYLQEQEEELRAAQTDPEKWAAYEEHLRQYQENPVYRRHVDQALRAREVEAVNEVYRQRDDTALINSGVETAMGWIQEIAADPRYQSVDPERVRMLYSQRLTAGQATLDAADVRAIFDAEADYLHQSVTPLQQQLATLTAKIEALEAEKAAEKQNVTTEHAVRRSKAPPVATGAAAPAPGARSKPERFDIQELPDRISQWANQRE